jgi:Kef-type K+ transport system membrane component KefB
MLEYSSPFSIFDHLPVLKSQKSPITSLLIGFFFGCIGLGIYFKSFTDFIIPLIMILVITLPTEGSGAPIGLLLVALYGYFRASDSNKRLGYF